MTKLKPNIQGRVLVLHNSCVLLGVGLGLVIQQHLHKASDRSGAEGRCGGLRFLQLVVEAQLQLTSCPIGKRTCQMSSIREIARRKAAAYCAQMQHAKAMQKPLKQGGGGGGGRALCPFYLLREW